MSVNFSHEMEAPDVTSRLKQRHPCAGGHAGRFMCVLLAQGLGPLYGA